MPTATINSTTWDASKNFEGKPWTTIRPYYLVRSGKILFPAAVTFFLTAFAHALHEGNVVLPLFLFSWGALLILIERTKRPGRSRVHANLSLEIYFAVNAAIMLFLRPDHGMQPTVADVTAGLMPLALTPAVSRLTTASRKRRERVLVVGDGDMASKLCRALDSDDSLACRPMTISGSTPKDGRLVDLSGLEQVIQLARISRVVVAEHNADSRRKVAAALVDLRLRGLEVSDALDFYEKTFGRIWIEALNSEWFVYTNGFRHSKASRFLKRCVDIVFSLFLLIATAPLTLITAVAVKLDSQGPVLFRQTRVGLFGKPFTIFKFRSMRVDAEANVGPRWATEGDDRMTRVGRIIRRFRLDEIPQALNVLRGEMSVVGPRPERPVFVDQLSQKIPFYDLRHYVKPGITGWAQVKYRYGASFEDAYNKLQYDIYYAKHRSLPCDLNILVKTVGIVLFAKGL